VLTLQRQAGNRATTRLLQRNPKAPAQGPPIAVVADMSRQDFEREIARFGVSRVAEGTKAEQESKTTGGRTIANWTAWSPPDPSPMFRSIVDAFEDFATGFGGTPKVSEILFFDMDYEVTGSGLQAAPNVPAAFQGGSLFVFRGFEKKNKLLPVARSDASGKYPSVTTGAPDPTKTGGAPLPDAGRGGSQRRIIVHELGHGLVEDKHAQDSKAAQTKLEQDNPGKKGLVAPAPPTLIDEFAKAVGWFKGTLYDIGDPAVEKAIQGGTQPSATPITTADWNSPKWKEQPMTDYSVSGGPSEDFPESLMAYHFAPDLLKARSPHRWKFFETNKGKWGSFLRAPTAKKPPGWSPGGKTSEPGDWNVRDDDLLYA
jgi:hypothetical protein